MPRSNTAVKTALRMQVDDSIVSNRPTLAGEASTAFNSPALELQVRLEQSLLASFGDREQIKARSILQPRGLVVALIAVTSWATVFGVGAFLFG